MLTDGQRTTGVDPLEAAKWAADRGVRVYTVGVGTVQGETIGFEGWSMRVRLDEETLKAVATRTNAEYFHALRDRQPDFRNSLSVGFDVETGGHVFQLHFTNSAGMFERAYITETTGDWARSFDDPSKGAGFQFGFNISRVFTVHEPRKRPL